MYRVHSHAKLYKLLVEKTYTDSVAPKLSDRAIYIAFIIKYINKK